LRNKSEIKIRISEDSKQKFAEKCSAKKTTVSKELRKHIEKEIR